MGLYTCIKSLKMYIKSDFEEIILKLATYGQREKVFLLSSKFCPQGVVCPCPGAIYMYKSIKIYTRTWCQVRVYRTTGPLVLNILLRHENYLSRNHKLALIWHRLIKIGCVFLKLYRWHHTLLNPCLHSMCIEKGALTRCVSETLLVMGPGDME